LFFGGLSKYKGVEDLIKAEPLIRARMPQATIRIAGFSANPKYHHSLVSTGQHIEFLFGRQTDEMVPKLFEWADVLVLPYIEASQSGVLLLGMAFGVPPVVTNVGGLPDVVVDRQNGLVVQPHDVQGLADAVVRLLSEQRLRHHVIENLVVDGRTTYSWDSIAARTVDVYRQLVATA
jgi:glycosyltransferase involved in cell wall biosynthesis